MKCTKVVVLVPVTVMALLIGCDSLMDLERLPNDIISGEIVFSDQTLAESYLADIYSETLFRYSDYMPGYSNHDHMLVEAYGANLRGTQDFMRIATAPGTVIDASGAGPLDLWPYDYMRAVNIFIKGMKESDFGGSFINQRVSEARYLRAHMYFEMVKRYGGVPIITEPQDPLASLDEMNVARNSEQEVYDFIASEMDAIAPMLPETEVPGRVTRYTALALKSRAMLYAASIGQFGTMQTASRGETQVQLGISNANAYYQASYDASRKIIESGRFKLYNKFPEDRAKNYSQLFIDEADNPERIFVEVFDAAAGRGQSWTNMAIPAEIGSPSGGAFFAPFLHTVETFQYADGSPGTIDRAKIESDELFDIDEVFTNRDPRFLASIFYPGSPFRDIKVTFHSRTVINGETKTSGTVGDGWPASSPPRNRQVGGFLVRKFMNEEQLNLGNRSGSEDWMVFRYGEILLNHAEAAFYLGQPGEALEKLNMIRERAGMPLLSGITEEAIRQERAVELMFEDHRFWDLRRWRTAQQELDGLRGESLNYTYYYDQDKYDFHLIVSDLAPRVFQERNYYLPLGIARLAENPNLVENPGY